jgi:hypothetical protein
MLNCVKSLLKVQFHDQNFCSGVVALMQVFICPWQTILYSLGSNKPILTFVNKLKYYCM